MILLVLIAAGGSAAGVYFLMGKGAHGADSAEVAPAEVAQAPIFVPISPSPSTCAASSARSACSMSAFPCR
ncbi:hypothetical protein ACE0DR_05555 [Azotobacter sp. CWF10]